MRVLEAARRLNYHPNSQAAALKSRRRSTWGMLSFWYFSPNSMDHYYSKILGGLLDAASEISYRVLLENVVGRFDQSQECARFCHESQLGGLVIVAPRCEEGSLQFIKSLQTPAVLVAYRPEDPELSFIDLDNKRAARMVVEHFVSKGHKRIAYVGGELELNANARDRYQGYLEGMKAAGLRVDPRWAHNKVFDAFFGAEALSRFMALEAISRPTAIFCATDLLALSLMEEAKRLGINIPSDLMVAGIDNNPESETCSPTLTSIHFPFYEMGAQAGEILKRLADNPRSPQRILLEPKLIHRDSSGGHRMES